MAKTIQAYFANVIGNNVASKAFEHEYTPLKEAADAATLYLHDMFFSRCITEKTTEILVDHMVLNLHSYCEITHEKHTWYVHKDSRDKKLFFTNRLKITLPGHVAEFEEKIMPAIRCRKRIRAMATAISEQIKGRSIQKVCKEWPEITEFIRDAMGDDVSAAAVAPMTVPFSALLQQFLALPAPTPTPTTTD